MFQLPRQQLEHLNKIKEEHYAVYQGINDLLGYNEEKRKAAVALLNAWLRKTAESRRDTSELQVVLGILTVIANKHGEKEIQRAAVQALQTE